MAAVTKAQGGPPLPDDGAGPLRAFLDLVEAPPGGFGLATPRR